MKKNNTYTERALIDSIQHWIKTKHDTQILGIGDDTAAVSCTSKRLLVSTDALVERTHFTRQTSSWYDLGWKSLAVNVSDIAAMGGKPLYALVTFAITKDMTLRDLKTFYQGFHALAKKTNTVLIGGDTVSSKKDAMISVTIMGECSSTKPVLRKGARIGDLICVTGTFGDAGFGLEQLFRGRKNAYGTKKFNQPMPRWKEGMKLAAIATSMMDCSDGLAACIHELMSQSKTGCEVHANAIPVSRLLAKYAGCKKALSYALYAGEDYELVFTIPAVKKHLLTKIPHITTIGKVTNTDCVLVDEQGNKTPLPNKGYDAMIS